ncbi:hypothetical protein [Bradyrhizobium retamae]|uniref:hypothetical protein n=1 Tax=Bradyrhizobium retamae TaxID=1300035 RepID=UPI0009E66D59|nr:hypothetical protein [Bradyrhizobium retamae]
MLTNLACDQVRLLANFGEREFLLGELIIAIDQPLHRFRVTSHRVQKRISEVGLQRCYLVREHQTVDEVTAIFLAVVRKEVAGLTIGVHEDRERIWRNIIAKPLVGLRRLMFEAVIEILDDLVSAHLNIAMFSMPTGYSQRPQVSWPSCGCCKTAS